jgi:hypothetical protein
MSANTRSYAPRGNAGRSAAIPKQYVAKPASTSLLSSNLHQHPTQTVLRLIGTIRRRDSVITHWAIYSHGIINALHLVW